MSDSRRELLAQVDRAEPGLSVSERIEKVRELEAFLAEDDKIEGEAL